MLKNKTAFRDCLEDMIRNQAGDLLTFYCFIQELFESHYNIIFVKKLK